MANKRKINFFVSYAKKNHNLAETFRNMLQEQLIASARYEYTLWQDGNLHVGEDWKKEIDDALFRCDFGLLLLSPWFLGSKFIAEEELPKFIGPESKPCFPVMLSSVDLDRHDLKGLKAVQIHAHEVGSHRRRKDFSRCSRTQREDFVLGLFQQIERRLDRLFSS